MQQGDKSIFQHQDFSRSAPLTEAISYHSRLLDGQVTLDLFEGRMIEVAHLQDVVVVTVVRVLASAGSRHRRGTLNSAAGGDVIDRRHSTIFD